MKNVISEYIQYLFPPQFRGILDSRLALASAGCIKIHEYEWTVWNVAARSSLVQPGPAWSSRPARAVTLVAAGECPDTELLQMSAPACRLPAVTMQSADGYHQLTHEDWMSSNDNNRLSYLSTTITLSHNPKNENLTRGLI